MNNSFDNNKIVEKNKSKIASSPNTGKFPIKTLQGEINLMHVSFTCSTNTSILPTIILPAKRSWVHVMFLLTQTQENF